MAISEYNMTYRDVVKANLDLINEIINKGLISKVNVKLQFLCSYVYGEKGSCARYAAATGIMEYSVSIRREGVVVGYKLKNVDTVDLKYLKAYYKEDGIQYKFNEIKPGEEFIVTRHELDFLMFLNGRHLINGVICRGDWKRVEPSEEVYIRPEDIKIKADKNLQEHLAYIRYKYDGMDSIYSIRDDSASYNIGTEDSNGKWHLLDKYRDTFYWVEMPKYMKSFDKKTNIYNVDPKYTYNRKSNEVLVDIYTGDVRLRGFNTRGHKQCKSITIAGDQTEEFINNFVNKAELLNAKQIEQNDRYTLVLLDKNLYIYSTYSIVVYPRYIFKKVELDILDISKAKLYGHSLKHVFYNSTINNLIIGDVETEEENGYNKLFSYLNPGTNIQTTNKDLITLIDNYNKQG